MAMLKLKPPNRKAAEKGNTAGSRQTVDVEDLLWRSPLEDRRGLDLKREDLFSGLSLASYVKAVDLSGRLFRQGEDPISAELAGIFARLKWSGRRWQIRLERLGGDRLLGRFYPYSRAKSPEIDNRLGVRLLVSLTGFPIR
jgi:hypothetical protein